MGITGLFKHQLFDLLGTALQRAENKTDLGLAGGKWIDHCRERMGDGIKDASSVVIDAENMVFRLPYGGEIQTEANHSSLTIRTAMRLMLRQKIKDIYMNQPGKTIYVVLDDERHVPRLKGVERERRQQASAKTQAKKEQTTQMIFRRDVHEFDPDATLYDHICNGDWMSFIGRRPWRVEVKKLMVMELVALSPQWCKESGCNMVIRSGMDQYYTVKATTMGQIQVTPRTRDIDDRIGEAELACFHFAREAQKEGSVVIVAEDTDAVGIALCSDGLLDDRVDLFVTTTANLMVLAVTQLHAALDRYHRRGAAFMLALLGSDYVKRSELGIMDRFSSKKLLAVKNVHVFADMYRACEGKLSMCGLVHGLFELFCDNKKKLGTSFVPESWMMVVFQMVYWQLPSHSKETRQCVVRLTRTTIADHLIAESLEDLGMSMEDLRIETTLKQLHERVIKGEIAAKRNKCLTVA